MRTLEVESITSEGAVFKGEIRDSPQPVTEHGFVWSLTDSFNGRATRLTLGPATDNGTFEVAISHDLISDTVYYVWAYAKTATHTVYGEMKSFRSLGSKAPVVESYEPKLLSWSDTVVIKGQNFSVDRRNVSVSISGVPLEVISGSLTEIKVRISTDFLGPKGKLAVSIFNNAAAINDSITLRPPVIESVNPMEGRSGDEVTIMGSYFHPLVSTVFFNGEAAEIVSRSKSSVECKVPDGLPRGPVRVSVQAGSQSVVSANDFYHQLPFLTGFFPSEGTFNDAVTLSGEDFNSEGSLEVFFGDVRAPIVSKTETEIVVNVPSVKSATPTIRLVNDGHTLTTSEPFRMLPPEIHSFTPIVEGGLHHITISGKNLNPFGGNTVLIDNRIAQSTPISTTELRVEIPIDVRNHEVPVSVIILGRRADAGTNLKVRWVSRSISTNFGMRRSGLKVRHGNELIAGIQDGYNALRALDLSTLNVRVLKPFPGNARTAYAYFVIGENLFVAGGLVVTNANPYRATKYDEVWMYNFPTDTWTRRNDLPFSGSSFVGFYGTMIGLSHEGKGFLIYANRMYQYFTETDSWVLINDGLPASPSSRGTFVGSDYYHKPISNDPYPLMIYNVISESWQTMSADFDLSGFPEFAFSYEGKPVFANTAKYSIYHHETNQWETRDFTVVPYALFGFQYNNQMYIYDYYSRLFTFYDFR